MFVVAHEAEGAGADRQRGEVGTLPVPVRNDGAGVVREAIRHQVVGGVELQVEPQPMNADVAQVGQQAAVRAGRVTQAQQRGGSVLRTQGAAVLEAQAGAQPELPVPAVGAGFPVVGEGRADRLGFALVHRQPVAQLHDQMGLGAARDVNRVQRVQGPVEGNAQPAAGARAQETRQGGADAIPRGGGQPGEGGFDAALCQQAVQLPCAQHARVLQQGQRRQLAAPAPGCPAQPAQRLHPSQQQARVAFPAAQPFGDQQQRLSGRLGLTLGQPRELLDQLGRWKSGSHRRILPFLTFRFASTLARPPAVSPTNLAAPCPHRP